MEWKLLHSITGMCFGTTATNSGHKNGCFTIFEKELVGKKALWLACLHHIYELIIKNVYRSLFCTMSSPENETFKYFRDVSWKDIDTSRPHHTLTFKIRIKKSRRNLFVDFYQNLFGLSAGQEKKIFPRGDCKECAEVMLQILCEEFRRGTHWYKPGAIYQALWMTAILYQAKIYVFQYQIDICSQKIWNFERLCKFNTLYYVPACLCSSNSSYAPINDLESWRPSVLYKRVDIHVADSAIAALERHLWYLSEESSVFALFSPKLASEEKVKNIKMPISNKKDSQYFGL